MLGTLPARPPGPSSTFSLSGRLALPGPPAGLLNQSASFPPAAPFIYLYSLQKAGGRVWTNPPTSLTLLRWPPLSTVLPLAETGSVNSFWLLIKSSLFLGVSVLAVN